MMKGTVLAMMITTATCTSVTATKTNHISVMTGNYYDYMVIETVDGNEWLLDDSEPGENQYMRYDEKCQNYVSVFHDGELVQAVFDTLGTDDLTDDIILTVRRID